MRLISVFLLVTCISIPAVAAEKYTGPRPPKADVPYLLHADNLIETEIVFEDQVMNAAGCNDRIAG